MAWSELPCELIVKIAKRLPLVQDIIRFSAMCKSWATAATKEDFPPLLMLAVSDTNADYRVFYNLFDDKCSPLFLPEARRQYCLPTQGWLFTMLHNDMKLLQPFSRRVIQLPDWYSLDDSQSSCGSEGSESKLMILHAVLSANPDRTGDYSLMVCYDVPRRPKVAFWRAGEPRWTKFDFDGTKSINCIRYFNGEFYIPAGDDIVVIDFEHPNNPESRFAVVVTIEHENAASYLVEASGKLFHVAEYRVPNEPDKTKFQVVELDVTHGGAREVKSLGDIAIFVGFNESISVPCSDFITLKPNHIYFDHLWYEHPAQFPLG